MKREIVYRIYYDGDGEIKSVSPTEEALLLPFVIVDQAAGEVFTSGKCRFQDYRIDATKDFPIVKKNLYDMPAGAMADKLTMLQPTKEGMSVIGSVVVSSDVVVVQISTTEPTILEQLRQLSHTEFCLYLTEKDQPNHLIESIYFKKEALLSQRLVALPRKSTEIFVSVFGSYLFTKFNLISVEKEL